MVFLLSKKILENYNMMKTLSNAAATLEVPEGDR